MGIMPLHILLGYPVVLCMEHFMITEFYGRRNFSNIDDQMPLLPNLYSGQGCFCGCSSRHLLLYTGFSCNEGPKGKVPFTTDDIFWHITLTLVPNIA